MKFDKKKFKDIRCELMWSTTAIAKKIGVTRKTIYNWEKGVSEPEEKKIFKIAYIFGISPHKITDIEESEIKVNVNLNQTTKTWTSMFQDRSSHTKDINYISSVLNKLNRKLNDASLVILGIMNSMNFPVYVKDCKHNYVMVNQAFLEYTGTRNCYQDSFSADHSFFHKRDADLNYKEDSIVLLTRTPVTNREDYIPGTKKKKWGLINKVPIIDEENEVAGVIGVFVDITKRKQEEEKRIELEKINRRLGKLVDIIDRTIAYKEFDAKTQRYKTNYVNNEIRHLAGIRPKEVVENDRIWLQKIVHPDDTKKRDLSFESMSYPKSLKYRIINSESNETKWIHETFYKNDNVIYFVGKDITEEKKDQKLLDALISSLNELNDAVALVGPYPYYGNVFVTDSFEKIYGYPKEKFRDENFFIDQCVHPDDRERLKSYRQKQQRPKRNVYRIVRPDGEIRWLETTSISTDTPGEYSVAIDRDITEEKKEQVILETLITSLNESDKAVALVGPLPYHGNVFMTDAYERIYGYPKEKFKDENFLIDVCVHPKDREKLRNYRKTHWPRIAQFRIVKPNGEIRWIETSSVTRENSGEYHAVIDRDITEEKFKEEQSYNKGREDLLIKLKELGVDQKILSQASELSEKKIKIL